jgi:hypothetical protein
MKFFGIVYLLTTTLVLVFKTEIDHSDESEQQIEYNLADSYRVAWSIFLLKPIQKLAILLFSIRVFFLE